VTVDRPQLKKLMAALTHGDVVIIPAVDRRSRDATDLLVIARGMQRAGAGLRSIAEPVVACHAWRRREASPRTSSARPANASTPARHNAALPAATTSVRRRFHGSQPDNEAPSR
jgi:hypothetical protein